MAACSHVFFIHECKRFERTYFFSLQGGPWIRASMSLWNKVFHPHFHTCHSTQIYSIVRVCSAHPSPLFDCILSSIIFPSLLLLLSTVKTNVAQKTPWQENNKFIQPCGVRITCYVMSKFYLRFTTCFSENKEKHSHTQTNWLFQLKGAKLCIYVTEISVVFIWRLDPSGIEFSWSAEIYIKPLCMFLERFNISLNLYTSTRWSLLQ